MLLCYGLKSGYEDDYRTDAAGVDWMGARVIECAPRRRPFSLLRNRSVIAVWSHFAFKRMCCFFAMRFFSFLLALDVHFVALEQSI